MIKKRLINKECCWILYEKIEQNFFCTKNYSFNKRINKFCRRELINQCTIFAGGKGKRLLPFTKKMPKPLVLVNNKPFIYYLLKQLESFKFKKILILAGYQSEKFENFRLKYSKKFKLKLIFIKQPVNWETAKRIYKIRNKLDNKFCLLYGDNLVNVKSNYFNWRANKVLIQSKQLALEKGNVSINKGIIKNYNERRDKKLNYVELGYFILKKKHILKYLNYKNISFSKIIYKLVEEKRLKFQITKSKYLSITDSWRLKKTNKNIKKYFHKYYK